MIRILLFLLVCLKIERIYAESLPLSVKTSARYFETQLIFPDKNNAEASPPGWNLYNDFPEKNEVGKSYLNRNSNQLLSAGLKYVKSINQVDINLDFDMVKGSEVSRDRFYTGKNSFLSLHLNEILIGVGKKEFCFRNSPFVGYADGGEGLFLEKRMNQKWRFQLFLYDDYRGFRLLEKEYLSPELLSGKEELKSGGQRRRHSFGFSYQGILNFTFGVSYLEFGASGKNSKELNQNVSLYGADGDSVVQGNLGLNYENRGFYAKTEFLWSKGVDRSYNQRTATPGSFLIEGEAFSFGFGYTGGYFHFGLSAFFSDREARDSQNRIIKLGYMNTGTHIGSTYFLSQYFRIFPSSQFSERGYERNQTLLSGSPQSMYGESFFSIQLYDILMKFTAAIIIPYLGSGESDGKISLKKENYEKFSLTEFSYDLSFKTEESQIGLTLSYLTSPDTLNIRGTMLQIYGSVIF
ncbi:hypothetical protein EHQ58_08155 [Leptospira ognonensis]|uniref:Alginate export domain-containing protein n=1 Tax=Leptospira ognonensis TaxID=2484945 RepID=A0A4R9K5R4_9LEPT|nr:hypothetical protein [Leptospira ognonensis]TGL59708.1 hypothetical protein EHQ58_08155 [Leptospira ognonensis]